MPLTLGGGINELNDNRELLLVGADKVMINSAYNNNNLIRDGANKFGSQCIVVGIDVKKKKEDYILYSNSGRKK